MHTHAWSFVGPLGAGEPRRATVVCDSPNLLRCSCGLETVVRCGTSRPSKCDPCAASYKGRVRQVAASGQRAMRWGGGLVTTHGGFLTVTAPGEHAHRRGKRGRWCRCTPQGGVDLARWNASASARFNRLMQDLRREPGLQDLEYFRATEVQKRGALHFHLLVKRRDGGVLAVDIERLRTLAIRHGFGHEVDAQPLEGKHAGYAAKYVAKGADQRPSVPWKRARSRVVHDVDPNGVILRSRVQQWTQRDATYHTWSSSRRWGLGMAAVKADQAHYAAVVAALAVWADVSPAPRLAVVGVPRRPLAPDETPPDLT